MATAAVCESGAEGEVLVKAATRFRSLVETLPDDHRRLFSSCRDGDTLLEGVRSLEILEKNRDHRYLGRIQSFIAAVQPFFSAIDVLSQVDPLHFALVWGGVRVLIQVRTYLSSAR